VIRIVRYALTFCFPGMDLTDSGPWPRQFGGGPSNLTLKLLPSTHQEQFASERFGS
jgi:hypothetical protein